MFSVQVFENDCWLVATFQTWGNVAESTSICQSVNADEKKNKKLETTDTCDTVIALSE